jgi:hypothetical protein
MSLDNIDQKENESLAFSDIKRMLGKSLENTNVILYDSLKNVRNVAELFGTKNCLIILLQIQTPNAPAVGHWIALLRYPNEIEHFDPYGFKIDQELSITHEQPWLSQILKTSNVSVRESTHKFQKLRAHVNTCGRWCVVRVRQKGLKNRDFTRFITNMRSDPDGVVTMLTWYL